MKEDGQHLTRRESFFLESWGEKGFTERVLGRSLERGRDEIFWREKESLKTSTPCSEKKLSDMVMKAFPYFFFFILNVLYNLFFVISTLFVGFQAALREGLHRFLLSLYQSLDNVVDM